MREPGNLEENVAACHRLREWGAAADAIVRELGPAIRGFLLKEARDTTLADDAYSLFSELVARRVQTLDDPARVRTWAYTVARGALRDVRRDWFRRTADGRGDEALDDVSAPTSRAPTAPWRRTTLKMALLDARRQLSPAERVLLALRTREGSPPPWAEIVDIFSDDAIDASQRAAWAAALRDRAAVALRVTLNLPWEDVADALAEQPLSPEQRAAAAQELEARLPSSVPGEREISPEDRTLVALRTDRQLSWSEIADILADHPLHGDARRRAESALRKRFERIRVRLTSIMKGSG